MHTEDANVSWF